MALGEPQDTKVCPNCGHCKECGRGGHQFVPVYPYPAYPWWWQQQTVPYPWPYTITYGSSSTGVVLADGPSSTATFIGNVNSTPTTQ